jgi:hypothetical protein
MLPKGSATERVSPSTAPLNMYKQQGKHVKPCPSRASNRLNCRHKLPIPLHPCAAWPFHSCFVHRFQHSKIKDEMAINPPLKISKAFPNASTHTSSRHPKNELHVLQRSLNQENATNLLLASVDDIIESDREKSLGVAASWPPPTWTRRSEPLGIYVFEAQKNC